LDAPLPKNPVKKKRNKLVEERHAFCLGTKGGPNGGSAHGVAKKRKTAQVPLRRKQEVLGGCDLLDKNEGEGRCLRVKTAGMREISEKAPFEFILPHGRGGKNKFGGGLAIETCWKREETGKRDTLNGPSTSLGCTGNPSSVKERLRAS